jgi:hypothetical protein
MAACMALLMMCGLASGERGRASTLAAMIAAVRGIAPLFKGSFLFLLALLCRRLLGGAVTAPGSSSCFGCVRGCDGGKFHLSAI